MKDTKEHIINTASTLFLQKNFKEVTMKEIVDKTGLSKGAFYHYFESKEKLFMEVIDNILFSQMYFDYDKYSNKSFYEFYHACANNTNVINETKSENIQDTGKSFYSPNFYFLIFDAMNLLPDFRKKMEGYLEKERNAWISAIKRARECGEIKTTLTDKHIASFFISTADGIALNLIIGGKYGNLKKELLSLWNEFYKSIKT
ncbi:MAG: TetR/AcrR family transcriptional regulator [Ignavibacteria bacterium]|nr:TetR/AcrR family transcriptional regulator [Ignavibacteria bacterium]